MAMKFDELTPETRQHMLAEFEVEEASGNPYRSRAMSALGLHSFPMLMRTAIISGTEETLAFALAQAGYWNALDGSGRRINMEQASMRLALTEFNTWYVRGLAGRLLDEGVLHCEVYRGAMPKGEPAECSQHEGQILLVTDVYSGHRARYWPLPGNPRAFAIPAGPSCHHTIRRCN